MGECTHPFIDTPTTLSSCEFEEHPSINTYGGRADVLCGILKLLDPRKKVAVKAFRDLGKDNALAIDNEIRIWRLLAMGTHSHIASFVGIAPVNLFDAKYFAKGPVSDYCVQGNLKTYLGKSDPDVIKHQLRFRLLLDVIRGVTHVHAQSIVHGDLKALNVLVDGDEGKQVARICDFGSSSINCVCYTGPREQEGTVLWDSPELWVPQEDSDETPSRTRQSDVWAFGCLALEVQMGLMPWDPLDERKPWPMKRRQLEAGMGPPATISDPKLDLDAHPIKRHVWNLMDLCWNADPQQRPTAADLLNRMLGISTAAM